MKEEYVHRTQITVTSNIKLKAMPGELKYCFILDKKP